MAAPAVDEEDEDGDQCKGDSSSLSYNWILYDFAFDGILLLKIKLWPPKTVYVILNDYWSTGPCLVLTLD